MNLGGPFFIGFRTLFGSRMSGKVTRHLIGAVLGIGFSLIPLIVVMEVSGGMIEGITRRFIEIGSYHLQIKNFSATDASDRGETIEKVEEVRGVNRAFEVVFGEGLVYSPNGRTGVSVRGLPEDYYSADRKVREYLDIHSGGFDLEAEENVLVSKEVARKLDVSVGEKIKLLTAKSMPGRTPILRPSTFRVSGVFSTGYYELDALSIYVHKSAAKRLFTSSSSTVVGVKIDKPYAGIHRVASDIRSVTSSDWYVYTWYSLERPMLESFKTTRNLLIFIMIIIIVVASFNISSSMIMLVVEKEPEIAILKSTGVHPRDIIRSFLATGFFIGVTGMIFGLSLGLAIAVNINPLIDGLEVFINGVADFSRFLLGLEAKSAEGITVFDESYYLEEIPIRLQLKEVFGAGFFTVLVAIVATYIPARKAGSLRPLDILRKY